MKVVCLCVETAAFGSCQHHVLLGRSHCSEVSQQTPPTKERNGWQALEVTHLCGRQVTQVNLSTACAPPGCRVYQRAT